MLPDISSNRSCICLSMFWTKALSYLVDGSSETFGLLFIVLKFEFSGNFYINLIQSNLIDKKLLFEMLIVNEAGFYYCNDRL